MSNLKTKSSNVTNKKQLIAELRVKHEPWFKAEGVGEKGKFIPKMAYIPTGESERIIAFFPSEISGGQDIYTEFVSKTYEPEDPERTLWKWEYNPHYTEEYKTTEPHAVSGHVRYLIPVDELINVAESYPAEIEVTVQKKMSFEDLPDPDSDQPIGELTIRDKAAIDWKKPVSKKKWLNELIVRTFGNGK